MAQTLSLSALATLPGSIDESSGLETAAGGEHWTHNDSGGEPKLYRINNSGAITRTLHVGNATNVDWEELARSQDGHLYIGDFGNNENNRTNLRIYRITDPDDWTGDTIPAEIIHFSYPDQTAFPPPPSAMNFDMEAMVHFGGNLYLFSKNRTDPFTGFSKVYRLPDAPGTYTAQLIDSFYTGPGPVLYYWITGADISPDGEKLVLTSHDKLWLFQCRNGRSFLDGQVTQIALSGAFTQKEAVVFDDNNTLFFTSEALLTFIPAQLFSADITSFFSANCCPAPQTFQGQTLLSGNIRYRWNGVSGANSYRIRMAGSDGTFVQKLSPDTTTIVSGLSSGLNYQAYVQARCGNLISGSSDTVGLSTLRVAQPPFQKVQVIQDPGNTQSLLLQAPESGSFSLHGLDGQLIWQGPVERQTSIALPPMSSSLLLWRWIGLESPSPENKQTGKLFWN